MQHSHAKKIQGSKNFTDSELANNSQQLLLATSNSVHRFELNAGASNFLSDVCTWIPKLSTSLQTAATKAWSRQNDCVGSNSTWSSHNNGQPATCSGTMSNGCRCDHNIPPCQQLEKYFQVEHTNPHPKVHAIQGQCQSEEKVQIQPSHEEVRRMQDGRDWNMLWMQATNDITEWCQMKTHGNEASMTEFWAITIKIDLHILFKNN